jgi:hypothetical protein
MMWDEMDLVEATLAVRLVGAVSVILNLTVQVLLSVPDRQESRNQQSKNSLNSRRLVQNFCYCTCPCSVHM